jgi:hypothetical protein
MPAMPPAALKNNEDIENKLAFQSIGTKLPIVEPTSTPIQMSVFLGMLF